MRNKVYEILEKADDFTFSDLKVFDTDNQDLWLIRHYRRRYESNNYSKKYPKMIGNTIKDREMTVEYKDLIKYKNKNKG